MKTQDTVEDTELLTKETSTNTAELNNNNINDDTTIYINQDLTDSDFDIVSDDVSNLSHFIFDEKFLKWEQDLVQFAKEWWNNINELMRLRLCQQSSYDQSAGYGIFTEKELINSALKYIKSVEIETRPSCIQASRAIQFLKDLYKNTEKEKIIENIEKWFNYLQVPVLLPGDFGEFLENLDR